MLRDDKWRIELMIGAIEEIETYRAGLTWDVFRDAAEHYNASLYSLVKLGESARNVSPDTKAAFPGML